MDVLDINGLRNMWEKIDNRDIQTWQILDMIMKDGSNNLFSLKNVTAGAGYTISVKTGVVTVDISGTRNSTYPVVLNPDFSLSAGTYFLSGCPKDGGSTKYYLDLLDSNGVRVLSNPDNGNGRQFTLENDTAGLKLIFISPNNGGVYSNLTVKPMIRKISSTSSIFVPNFNSIIEMQNKIDELENRIAILEQGSN